MKKIIYTRPDDGGLSVIIPASKESLEQVLGPLTEEQYEDYVRKRSIPEGAINVRDIEETDFPPSMREFRNAWCDMTTYSCIDVDLAKAKDIKLEELRRLRDPELENLDKQLMIAQEVGGDVDGIKAKKQALRDATEPLKNLVVSGYNDEAVLQKIRELGTLNDPV